MNGDVRLPARSETTFWARCAHARRWKDSIMITNRRFLVIQAPDGARGSDPVACAICGAVRPAGEARVVISEYEAIPDAPPASIATLTRMETLYACGEEHAHEIRKRQ